MSNTKIQLVDLEKHQAKTDEIINKIIANPEGYDKKQLQKVVDAMKKLVKKTEAKLNK